MQRYAGPQSKASWRRKPPQHRPVPGLTYVALRAESFSSLPVAPDLAPRPGGYPGDDPTGLDILDGDRPRSQNRPTTDAQSRQNSGPHAHVREHLYGYLAADDCPR